MGVGARSLTIALFRNDLRVHDNPILSHAHLATVKEGDSVRRNKVSDYVLPLYVFDERQVELSGLEGYQSQAGPARTEVCGFWRTGCHRLNFLCQSVYELKHQLQKRGSDLLVRFGVVEATTIKIIEELQRNGFTVDHVYMAKEAAFEEVGTEKRLAGLLAKLAHKVPLTLFHSRSLVHPDDLPFTINKTPDVYTPFRSRVESLPAAKLCRPLLPLPEKLVPFPSLPDSILKAPAERGYSGSLCEGEGMEAVFRKLAAPLLASPNIPQPDSQQDHAEYTPDPRSAFPYQGGESEALRRLDDYFFKGDQPPVRTYKTTRNGLLGHAYSTKFSPFLALGCISPRKIIHSLWDHEAKLGSNKDTYWVLFEILWRDYFIFISQKFGRTLFLLKGFEGRMDPKGAAQKLSYWKPFRDEKMKQGSKGQAAVNRSALAWLKGTTGVPFIDANMIELRESGFMSNRGRQNVASFLAKDLELDWRIGAEWFESELLDYDPCSNYGNWQYVAGVGNDPRTSRQFNPIKQAKDYDAQGEYVKHWIPELKNFPANRIHSPWLMNSQEWDKYLAGPHKGDTHEKGAGQEYPRRPILEQQAWKKHYQRR
ncbi:hypothetical protein PTTG_08408 [Puccinia triticina 1-1 BBBD Race 1]|uniref:Cryptochrome DASH n=2 Tax=Puccinia triticina TaxID=208348 RepID=A0A180H4C7_PUCT1|nr:uncharacterized protein PtA15_13A459 [Puccinia triticina]OAV99518.1 hypothetical protein PTTG_08408 [Puccinia triticina 1-1 BBBD Race 1]WAQ91058.1 hypothetical protein PtA15_13A459 [Puccinia triticina]WAR61249.1 hypothetical protein PtB15_13B502 [Puccinia triticina]